jgi:hypothetical protein
LLQEVRVLGEMFIQRAAMSLARIKRLIHEITLTLTLEQSRKTQM